MSTSFFSGFEHFRTAIRIVLHPDYNSSESPRDDIALLVFDEPITNVQPVRFNREAKIPLDSGHAPLTVIGLGYNGTYDLPDYLMSTKINAVPQLECIKRWTSFHIEESNLCAGGDGVKGVCDGDSGGPILVQGPHAHDDKLVGITSFAGYYCAQNKSFDVFTRVSYYADWIDQSICDFSDSSEGACDNL